MSGLREAGIPRAETEMEAFLRRNEVTRGRRTSSAPGSRARIAVRSAGPPPAGRTRRRWSPASTVTSSGRT